MIWIPLISLFFERTAIILTFNLYLCLLLLTFLLYFPCLFGSAIVKYPRKEGSVPLPPPRIATLQKEKILMKIHQITGTFLFSHLRSVSQQAKHYKNEQRTVYSQFDTLCIHYILRNMMISISQISFSNFNLKGIKS
jgi:hypothetical protein